MTAVAPVRGPLSWGSAVQPLCAAGLLYAATPPALVPAGGFLVLPGLMLWFHLARTAARPLRASYLLGVLHMAAFSWSLRHVLLPAWIAVALVGGLYYAAATAATRALHRWLGPFAFGVAVAAASWLRAEMPEICYPHGQPCHCLWQWPQLLGAVTLGGEALANLLLGASAAALVDIGHAWRRGVPSWRLAWLRACLVLGAAVAATIAGSSRGVPASTAAGSDVVDVLCVEPGVHPIDPYEGLPPDRRAQRFWQLVHERLHAPTMAAIGSGDAPPPALVLWPESALPFEVEQRGAEPWFPPLRPALELHPDTRLLVGAGVARAGSRSGTPAAVLLSDRGRYLGHHEKQRLVPGGEFVPFVGWLPARWGEAVHDLFRATLGSAPDCVPGSARAPLQTAGGVPFAALLCYDNAFPAPAAAAVASGARFLVVLSNEAWYRGGGELEQLLAMTVMRALETRTAIVRCTTDGRTAAVSASGQVLTALAPEPAPARAARTLRISVPLRSVADPALASYGPWFGAGSALLLGAGILHALWLWARLRVARPAMGTNSSSHGGR